MATRNLEEAHKAILKTLEDACKATTGEVCPTPKIPNGPKPMDISMEDISNEIPTAKISINKSLNNLDESIGIIDDAINNAATAITTSINNGVNKLSESRTIPRMDAESIIKNLRKLRKAFEGLLYDVCRCLEKINKSGKIDDCEIKDIIDKLQQHSPDLVGKFKCLLKGDLKNDDEIEDRVEGIISLILDIRKRMILT